jgi:hypothetical protein
MADRESISAFELTENGTLVSQRLIPAAPTISTPQTFLFGPCVKIIDCCVYAIHTWHLWTFHSFPIAVWLQVACRKIVITKTA